MPMADKVPVYYYVTNTLPAILLSVMGMTYYVYIPKMYADEAVINLTVLGVVILLSRVWDAVIDPVIGSLSDHTHSRWGRRKPWMAVGSILLCIVFYLLLNPPESISPMQRTMWFAVGSFFFFVCWTAVTVPYEALGVELTFDYDQRTRLLGIRESGILIGTFLASLIPFVMQDVYGEDVKLSALLAFLSIWYCLALLISSGLAVWTLQPHDLVSETAQSKHKKPDWRVLAQNKPFRLLLIAFAFTSFGQYLSASLILFYTEHVLGSSNGSQFLALYIAIAFFSIPFWLYLARFTEKRVVWIVSMISTLIPFLFVLPLGEGDGFRYGILITLSALCSGGMLTLPVSMQADVIDLDEYETGKRREGLYIGVWALFRKLSAAVGTGLAFPVLDWYGYTSSGEQPESALHALRFLYAGAPSICYMIACGFIWFYPVNRAYHQQIRHEIDNRFVEPKAVLP